MTGASALLLRIMTTRLFSLLMLLLSLSLVAGQVRAQCGSLSGPSTTWSAANGSWAVGSNWTNGTPAASTNACILDGTSTVTLYTTGNANALQLAGGNVLNINAGGSLNLYSDASASNGVITVQGNPSGGDAVLINNSGGYLTNTGTIGVSSGEIINNSGAYLTNTGAISVSNDYAHLTNSGTFINGSTISLAVHVQFDNSGYFVNSGTISQESGTIGIGGTFNNIGTLTVFSGSDPVSFTTGGTFNNTGTLNISLVNLIPNSYSNLGILNNAGTINLAYDSGSFPVPISNSGTINNSGVFNLSTTNAGGPYQFTNSFTNSGILNNSGTVSNNSASTINNTGLINNTGIFANSGTVSISNTGLFTTSTNYTQTDGSTLVNGTLTATGAIVDVQGGMLGGTGTINGNVLMAGIMMPGDDPGTLTIIGNYEQTGTGIFDEQMSPYSQAFLDVSGNVVLDPGGSLEITLLDGFNPLGVTISIMDFSTLSGQFANGSSFWDDNYLWDITYRQHEIDVTAVKSPEPGSFLLLGIGSLAIGAFAKRKKVAQ